MQLDGESLDVSQDWIQSDLWFDLVDGFELYGVGGLFVLVEGSFGG